MKYFNENQTPRDRIDRSHDGGSYGAQGHTERRAYPRRPISDEASAIVTDACCKARVPFPVPLPLVMVYAPDQQWRELYDTRTALAKGSLFRELVFPWYPTPCARGENCR